MRTTQAVVFVLFLAARMSVSGPQHGPRATQDDSRHLIFVRQFSSAQDVKGELHPVLNRSLDIIAGPKEAEPATYALRMPYGVTTDLEHRVFVTDLGTGTVHVFDFPKSKYSVLRGGDRLRTPMGIAADREGNLYVSDSGLQAILVYDSRGKFVRHLMKTRGESYFDNPRGIAVDPATGRIYVCDASRHMVFTLDNKGRVLARFGKRFGGNGPGEFRYPTQVVVAADEIVILDSGNSRAQILDVRGHFLKEIRLADPSRRAGLAMDNEKNIYLTDPEINRLRVFNHDGKFLYDFGERGMGPGQFNGISGIWVDAGHCLYVADAQNKRVQLFQISGASTHGC